MWEASSVIPCETLKGFSMLILCFGSGVRRATLGSYPQQ